LLSKGKLCHTIYHEIFISKFKLKVNKAPLYKEVRIRISPDEKTGIAGLRIWYKDILTDVYQV